MQYTKSTSSAFNYIFNIIQVHPFIKQFIERVNTTRISYISNTNYAIIIIIMIMAQPKHRLILLGRIIMSHHHEHICTRINCTGNPSSGSAFALIYFSHLHIHVETYIMRTNDVYIIPRSSLIKLCMMGHGIVATNEWDTWWYIIDGDFELMDRRQLISRENILNKPVARTISYWNCPTYMVNRTLFKRKYMYIL